MILLDPHGRTVDTRPAGAAPEVVEAVGVLARRAAFGLAAGQTPTGRPSCTPFGSGTAPMATSA